MIDGGEFLSLNVVSLKNRILVVVVIA